MTSASRGNRRKKYESRIKTRSGHLFAERVAKAIDAVTALAAPAAFARAAEKHGLATVWAEIRDALQNVALAGRIQADGDGLAKFLTQIEDIQAELPRTEFIVVPEAIRALAISLSQSSEVALQHFRDLTTHDS